MNKYIDPQTAEQIKRETRLDDIINDFIALKKKGKAFTGKCPMCLDEHSLNVDPDKKLKGMEHPGVYKCFKCDFGGNSAVNFLMTTQNKTYNEALQYMAEKSNIIIPEKVRPVRERKTAKDTSFKNRQLESSGLTKKDVKAWELHPDGKRTEIDVFQAATLSPYNRIVSGDDMIIHYLDLDGCRVKYQVRNEKSERDFYRVRWQFPESHLDRGGKPKKYESPVGSSITLYIPETLRRIYREGHTTKRLFFTEGEKKAEKLCKHGYPAFGMPGINALVGKEKSFPESVVRVIEKCNVKEVFFVLDSDFRDLSQNLNSEKDITERSRMFFYAVKNFRDWFQTLANRKLYLEVYMVGGKGQEKGVDDLLTGSLSGKESMYGQELEQLINGIVEEAAVNGDLFELHKISTLSDLKLRDIWNLNDKKEFCDYHSDILKSFDEFKYGRNKWRYNGDDLELAQPLLDDEKFYSERITNKRNGDIERNLQFDYVNMKRFFRNRGFYRLRNEGYPNELIRVEESVIRVIDHVEARDYAMEIAEELFDKEVQNMLIKGSAQYFGPEKLNQIAYFEPNLYTPERDCEYLFFKQKYWKISAAGIEEKSITELNINIWHEQLKKYDATRLDRLISIHRDDKQTIDGNPVYTVKFTDNGEKCDFVKFLWYTSVHKWSDYYDDNRQPKEVEWKKEHYNDACLHFLSKMTAIGYMLHKYRDKNCEKAIIGMDAKISEVGDSFGRSGKSLLGFAISYVKNQAYIDAKRADVEQDRFLWQEVNRKTENIFIDDVRVNFDFEMLFTIIVGRMTVEGKGQVKYTLKDHDVPKIYLTTNHMLNGSSSSHRDRQFKLAFSDFFDDEFKPYEMFGKSFFTEWGEEQWNLFYNFMGECLELYFVAQKNGWGVNRSGLIAAPCDNLERRQARQEMGEAFFNWFNDYLGITEENFEIQNDRLNTRLVRNDLQEEFLNKHPREKHYYTPNKFWKKIIAFCRYYGFRLNPVQTLDSTKPGHDKSSGIEYVTIANRFFDVE